MSRFLAAALALTACFSAPALAENGTGSVTVEPGLWAWTHETIIGQMPINESSTQCIHPGQNQMSLKEMAEELNNDCQARDITETNGAYAFTLTCSGQIPGQAKGSLTKKDGVVEMRATGYANALGFMAPFTMKASATRQGDC